MLLPQDIHPLSDAQKNLSAAIRIQWRLFEKWLTATRNTTVKRREELCKVLEDEMLKSKRDTPWKFHVLLQDEYDAKKSALKRHLDEEVVHLAQLEWERRLSAAGLDAEDWLDITPAEKLAVERALGGEPEAQELTPISQPNGTATSHAAASLSKTWGQAAQSTNPPAFEFVSTAAFREEAWHEEGLSLESYLQADSRVREEHDDHRASDPPGSTQSTSPERSPPRNAAERASQPISPVDLHDFRYAKSRAAGHRYIGPILHDEQDTKMEEADFEKFKVEIREKKIWEFHYEAAQAGTRISRQLCDRNLDKQKMRVILAEHDRCMENLRRIKEDERKAIVDNERAKRQTEFRRRNALHDATAKPWKPFEAIMETVPERDPDKEPAGHNGQRLARDGGFKQVNGEKATPQSGSALPQSQITEEIKTPGSGRRRRGRDDPPVASTSRQVIDSAQNSIVNSHQPQRVEDIWLPGGMEQKKPSTGNHQDHASKKSPKVADQSPISDLPESLRRDITREKEVTSTPTKSLDGTPSAKSRRSSLQQDIWRPEGFEGPPDIAAFGTRRKAFASTSGATLDSANSSNRIQNKGEEFWIPGRSEGQQDEPTEQKQVAGSSTKTTGSILGSKLPQSWSVWGLSHDPELRQGRPTERLAPTSSANASKPSNAISSAQVLRDPVVWEGGVRGIPSPQVTEKQSHDVSVTQDLGSTALETAQAVMNRPRRASDPPPPSPNIFNVSAVQKQKSEGAADVSKQPKSILKKSDRKTGGANAPSERKNAGGKRRQPPSKKTNPVPKPRKPVTVEEVSDEEADPIVCVGPVESKPSKKTDADRLSDSSVIAEPKPSIPSSSFSQIFQYAAEEETISSIAPASASAEVPTPPPGDSRPTDIWYPTQDPSTDLEDEEGWNLMLHPVEERTNKAKHVRWTPSVLSNGGRSSSPDGSVEDSFTPFRGIGKKPFTDSGGGIAHVPASAHKAKPRGRSSSLIHTFDGAMAGKTRNDLTRDLKGKGKEKAGKDEAAETPDDDLAWYAREAIESLKAMRSKPASAV